MLTKTPTVEEDVLLSDTKLGAYTQIQAHSVLHESTLGDFSYCAGYNQIYYANIGKFCSIASFVRVGPGNHPTYTRVAQHHFTYRSEQFGFGEDDDVFFAWRREDIVTIGNDVWIGFEAIILSGVKIGDGAIVGARAVVTKDVPPYAIVGGVPAKMIRRRFPDETVSKLLELRWWDWPPEKVRAALPAIRSGNWNEMHE